ncbi:MAG: HAD-IA family hydrolase [Kiloniellales bacterium]|nr:HAD-IA family hydrolase [Kiloniellales bacterium]
MAGPEPRLIVFDLDGTLVDSQHIIVEAMSAAFSGSGFAPPEARSVRRVVGLSLEEAVARLLPDAASCKAEAVADRYRDAFLDLHADPAHEEPLYPGALETLAALDRPETLLGIATGKGRSGLRRVLQRHGLLERFVTLQTADDGPGKPDPAMLSRAMAEAGVERRATLMVGDTTFDMEMARRAGILGIGVGWGYHEPEELLAAGASRIVEAFDELEALLSEILPEPGRDRQG